MMATFKQQYFGNFTQVKKTMAKMLGLVHVAYNVWKDKSGTKYIWNNKTNHFDKFEGKQDEI